MLETLWVRFAHPDDGFISDQENCRKYLELGKPYRVVHLEETSSWMTRVKIEDVGNRCLFNSVMFDFYNNKMEAIPFSLVCNSSQYEDYWNRDII